MTGASDLEIDLRRREVRVGDTVLSEGDRIAIDGTTGCITTDDVPLVEPEVSEHFERVLAWADELRTLGVRTNADTPEDAQKAREFGAEGIGLCRTEHMFFGEDRHELMVEAILAETDEERKAALDELRPLQQDDFEGLFEAMEGLPVTIRLLDPPLHEFLPHRHDVEQQVERARIEQSDDLDHLERMLDRVRALEETNPMLGTRGVRLGLLQPDLYEMQVEAIFAAAANVRGRRRPMRRDHDPARRLRARARAHARAHRADRRAARPRARARTTSIGTMIELPRACFLADAIADARRLLLASARTT